MFHGETLYIGYAGSSHFVKDLHYIPVCKRVYELSKPLSSYTVLVLSKLKKINATAPQPQRNVLRYFAIFKNVAHSLEPGETPSISASHQASNFVQRS